VIKRSERRKLRKALSFAAERESGDAAAEM